MINIMPLSQLESNDISELRLLQKLQRFSSRVDLHDIIGNYELFNSGKEAIRAIIKALHLKREDEVFITTTTESSYVTSCVSATIFNYCKLSRVLTENTRAIFVIHTYCFPHPQLMDLRKQADELGIPLIEDCISAFDSCNGDGIRLGSVGDYAVYSLPKIIPARKGGILTSSAEPIKGIADEYISAKIREWQPYLMLLKKRRQDNYSILKKMLPWRIYRDDKNVNPFMYGFYCANSQTLMQKFKCIEFGLTHVDTEVHIPLNPFVNFSKKMDLIARVAESVAIGDLGK